MQHIVVVNVAGLSPGLLQHKDELPCIRSLMEEGYCTPVQPVFPAVTSPMQATLMTGAKPDRHGIVGNGWFDRDRLAVEFWGRSARLVQTPRVWEQAKSRQPDLSVAAICWQQTMGCAADYLLTPAPIHAPGGRMISACYSRPAGLYDRLAEKHGPFDLAWSWGPSACIRSSQWIGEATRHVLRVYRPSLTMAYLPHLDYVLQRAGPFAPEVPAELRAVDAVVAGIVETASDIGARVVVVSEYGVGPVVNGLCINRELRNAGLLSVREVEGREYLDVVASAAFAVVDHQIAHVYCEPGALDQTAQLLEGTAGIDKVLDAQGKLQMGIEHARSGDLVVIADPDRWFAYYWWNDPDRAPVYARTVDIHNKPGYDPVELFFDPKQRSIPIDETLVKGSHGRLPEDDAHAAVLIVPEPPPSGPVMGRLPATDVMGLVLNFLMSPRPAEG